MPLHPLTVHLPIGLLLGNLVFTILAIRRADPTLEMAGYHCLWLGFLFILPAVAVGIWDAVRYVTGPGAHPEALGWINAHAASGIALAIIYWQAWQIRRRNALVLSDRQARRGYLARLAIGAALLILSGWLGGHLVYVLGVGVQHT